MSRSAAIEDGIRDFCNNHKLDEECVGELSDIMKKVLGNFGKEIWREAPNERREAPNERREAPNERREAPNERPIGDRSSIAEPKTESKKKAKCISKNKKGEPCRFYSVDGTEYCKMHCPKEDVTSVNRIAVKCNGMTDGRICDKKGEKVDGAKYNYCSRHKGTWKLYEGVEPVSQSTGVEEAESVLTQLLKVDEKDDSDYELFNGTDSDDELTFDQRVEMVANDMDILEYKTSTKIYDDIKAEKKLTDNEMDKYNLPEEVVKKAVEKAKSSTKKSTSWVKKMQDKLKKNSDIMEMKKKRYEEEYDDEK